MARSRGFFLLKGEHRRRENESFSSASREKGSGYMLFIIEMTHMEPLESEGYKFKQERFRKSQPQDTTAHTHQSTRVTNLVSWLCLESMVQNASKWN